MSFNVAIDGPAGAGKSTVAKSVAALKNFICRYRSNVPGNGVIFSAPGNR